LGPALAGPVVEPRRPPPWRAVHQIRANPCTPVTTVVRSQSRSASVRCSPLWVGAGAGNGPGFCFVPAEVDQYRTSRVDRYKDRYLDWSDSSRYPNGWKRHGGGRQRGTADPTGERETGDARN